MTAIKHTFRAEHNPTNQELHCLWSTLTDKAHEQNHDWEFKVEANNKLVSITSDKEIPAQDVELESNRFVYLRSKEVKAFEFENGQFVRLQGTISYSVRGSADGKDYCPVDGYGQLKEEFGKKFLQYLSKSTGVDFERAAESEMLHFSFDSEMQSGKKVWLNDIIIFDATSNVVDSQKLNSLSYCAIGRRKSFGLGNVVVAESESCEVE